jgi:hypothetical protein
MILAGVIVGLMTIFVAGFGVTLLLLRTAPRLNGFECFCLAWLFGCGAVSILLFACGTLVSGLPLQVLVMVCCVAIGFCGWKMAQRSRVQFVFPLPTTLVQWLLVGIIALQIGAIFFISAKHTLGWDGLSNWEIKARYAFLNGGSMPAQYYQSDSRAFSHPQYPLMIPMTELWLYLWMGEPNQFGAKAIFPFFYVTGSILLALLGGRLAGRPWPGYVAAVLLFFVPIVTNENGGVVVGYADFPLSIFYLVAIGYLLSFLAAGEGRYFYVYAASLALLPWIKREGSILWLVGGLAGALVLWRNKHSYRAWIILALTPVILLAWQIYLKALHPVVVDDFLALNFSTFRLNAGRAIPIGRELLIEMARLSDWSLFWLLVVTAFLYRFARRRDLCLLILFIAVVAPISVYAGTYVFSGHKDYFWHIATSLPRLLMQIVPAAWLVVALAMRPPDFISTKPSP